MWCCAGWLTEDRLTYMIAVSESTPGPIMVNMATYIGSSQAGIPGAVVATTAVVLPSFVIILLIAALLNNLMKNAWIKAAMGGLKACVVGIILATGVWMTAGHCFPAGMMDWKAAALALILGLLLFGAPRLTKKKVSPVAFIALSALFGMAVYGF